MIAFHGDPKIKEKYLARVRAHRAADHLVKGTGWENGKGCAIGCTLEAYEHSRYETELGIPTVLAKLEDRIFESLPSEDAMEWPERFLSAAPVGADLSRAWSRFAAWMLRECLALTNDEKVRGVLDLVAYLYETGAPSADLRWEEARYAAFAAYAAAGATAYTFTKAAAYAAAVKAAAYGAYADADAYAVKAANAAANAAYAGHFWKAAAEQLLTILSTAERK